MRSDLFQLCDELPGFLDNVCKDVVADEIDTIYKWINEETETAANSICNLLSLC